MGRRLRFFVYSIQFFRTYFNTKFIKMYFAYKL